MLPLFGVPATRRLELNHGHGGVHLSKRKLEEASIFSSIQHNPHHLWEQILETPLVELFQIHSFSQKKLALDEFVEEGVQQGLMHYAREPLLGRLVMVCRGG